MDTEEKAINRARDVAASATVREKEAARREKTSLEASVPRSLEARMPRREVV